MIFSVIGLCLAIVAGLLVASNCIEKREAEERANQRRLEYYRNANMQPRQVFSLGNMTGVSRD